MHVMIRIVLPRISLLIHCHSCWVCSNIETCAQFDILIVLLILCLCEMKWNAVAANVRMTLIDAVDDDDDNKWISNEWS